MRLKNFRAEETVFKLGDMGHEFFIILDGLVRVQVPTKVKCDSKETFMKELVNKYEHVIWRSIDDYENIRF
jgi:CRP-like cAMP-binding protein